jgi:hypothetical protein
MLKPRSQRKETSFKNPKVNHRQLKIFAGLFEENKRGKRKMNYLKQMGKDLFRIVILLQKCSFE